MDNLHIYNASREVPKEALKEIAAGRLKGMTDINPVWRIKKLTELFGPCGVGWYYTKPEFQFVPGDKGTIACFAQTNLIYRDADGWSQPIPGIGGAMYVTLETKGLYTDDEAPKKALTDALSVACKALGIGADVYFQKDTTKYTAGTPAPAEKPQTPRKPVAQKPPVELPFDDSIPKPKAMATAEQIEFIVNNSDEQTYSNAMMAFGANLEKMTRKQAEKLIARIKEVNPDAPSV